MILRETNETMYINGLALPLAVFCHAEPEHIPVTAGWHRSWSDRAQYITDGHTQQGDPFYTPERFAHYCSRLSVYQRALAAANYTTTDSSDLFDAGQLSTLLSEGELL